MGFHRFWSVPNSIFAISKIVSWSPHQSANIAWEPVESQTPPLTLRRRPARSPSSSMDVVLQFISNHAIKRLLKYLYHDLGMDISVYAYIYIYLDLRKGTNNCPFARFLPLGQISCEGAGSGHFLTTVVKFGFRTFWADLTLLCVKMCRFFWAEIPGKRAEIPGQIHDDSKMKTWSGKFFLDMVIFILKWANLQKMDRNQTKICPGKKFVTNEYPGIYIYI